MHCRWGGRVRSLTPKVERKFRRLLTGRAKKRLLYNIRIKNALPPGHPSYRTRNQQLAIPGRNLDFIASWQNRGIRKAINQDKQTLVLNGDVARRWIKHVWGVKRRYDGVQSHHRKVKGSTGIAMQKERRLANLERAHWTVWGLPEYQEA